MVPDAEISTFDLRYESYRLKNPALEARLCASILERGIEESLEGVDAGGRRILLDGFKRYRCARKLDIAQLPYLSLGDDEATGIVAVMRGSPRRSLTPIEEARFVDDLRRVHRMTVAEIATTLWRSKGWVSMRLGLIGEMSAKVQERIFRGDFPVYSYMYDVRPFMRMNGVEPEDVEKFVEALSGRKLSIREIDRLAEGYFRGPEWFRTEVLSGNLALPLERMAEVPAASDGCSGFERVLLRDLETLGKYMQRVVGKSQDQRLRSGAFCAQAHLLLPAILSGLKALRQSLSELYDRTGQA